MSVAILPTSTKVRSTTVADLRNRLNQSGKTLAQAITERDLYFRVSLIGACNLSCPFCHNEGGPLNGRMDLGFGIEAIKAAVEVGFTRVQFTGGEPLLHPKVPYFVEEAKKFVADVGITTNGTFLQRSIQGLLGAGITRVHISLQVESLEKAGDKDEWGIPTWLSPMLDLGEAKRIILRLNMPVPQGKLVQAKRFLESVSRFGCDLKVFSILPEGKSLNFRYPMEDLIDIVNQENERRRQAGIAGLVFLRNYRPPQGIRCHTCPDFSRCKEQSHSLRLGADHMLRPCLATREWDSLLTLGSMVRQIEEASLLALDF